MNLVIFTTQTLSELYCIYMAEIFFVIVNAYIASLLSIFLFTCIIIVKITIKISTYLYEFIIFLLSIQKYFLVSLILSIVGWQNE